MSTVSERYRSAEAFAKGILDGMDDASIVKGLERMNSEVIIADDLMGMLDVFYPTSLEVSSVHPHVLDMCGTGGASLRTFNVSTISSFIVSAAGVPVVKHGNRSSIGRCGSADLMDALGAKVSISPSDASTMLDKIGYTFLYAPSYHPSMAKAANARKLLGTRSIFNLMGPLMNPVRSGRRHLMGVNSPDLLDMMPRLLDHMGVDRAIVVYGEPGMDEVSLLGPTRMAVLNRGGTDSFTLDVGETGLRPLTPDAVRERTPEESADLCRCIMDGEDVPERDMVLLNSSVALMAFGMVSDIGSGIRLAEEVLDKGIAKKRMQDFICMSRGEAHDGM